VDLDKARDRDALRPGGQDAQPDDDSVLYVDVTVDQLAAGERSLYAQPHARTSGLDQSLYR
jgi:hypothetical protein